jgi:hypothetical protein
VCCGMAAGIGHLPPFTNPQSPRSRKTTASVSAKGPLSFRDLLVETSTCGSDELSFDAEV